MHSGAFTKLGAATEGWREKNAKSYRNRNDEQNKYKKIFLTAYHLEEEKLS